MCGGYPRDSWFSILTRRQTRPGFIRLQRCHNLLSEGRAFFGSSARNRMLVSGAPRDDENRARRAASNMLLRGAGLFGRKPEFGLFLVAAYCVSW